MKKKKEIGKPEAKTEKAQLSKEESKAIVQQQNQPKGKCPMRFVVQEGQISNITFKESTNFIDDSLKNIQKLTSTQDVEMAAEIFDRGLAALPNSHNLTHRSNLIVQSLADANPQDALEAKLCMQETVLYAQGMQCLSRSENADRFEQSEFYMKNAVKLLRLHNETIEMIIKYRRGGEQRVVVQHLNVNDGGQAIVGNVIAGGGINKKSDEVIP